MGNFPGLQEPLGAPLLPETETWFQLLITKKIIPNMGQWTHPVYLLLNDLGFLHPRE